MPQSMQSSASLHICRRAGASVLQHPPNCTQGLFFFFTLSLPLPPLFRLFHFYIPSSPSHTHVSCQRRTCQHTHTHTHTHTCLLSEKNMSPHTHTHTHMSPVREE